MVTDIIVTWLGDDIPLFLTLTLSQQDDIATQEIQYSPGPKGEVNTVLQGKLNHCMDLKWPMIIWLSLGKYYLHHAINIHIDLY